MFVSQLHFRTFEAFVLSIHEFSGLESVVVAQSGDLAYVTYTYEMGNPVAERGKDVSIYRKEPDGSWKLIIDMWSPD